MSAGERKGLERYRAKRRFDISPEPRGDAAGARGSAFVVQKHAARRLHYDLRLELDGVMLSWAVTRGPSLVPGEKRLAMHVEDHPIEYNQFEGTIPAGQYGAGTVMIWDRGTWQPDGDPRKGYKKGHLDFRLDGEKLTGRWHLVRMRKRDAERGDPWLLIKSDDEAAQPAGAQDILDAMPLSVATGRDMDEIAAGTKAAKLRAASRGGSGAKTARKTISDTKAKATRTKAAKKTAKTTKAARKKTRTETDQTTAKSTARRALNAPAALKRAAVADRLPDAAPRRAKAGKREPETKRLITDGRRNERSAEKEARMPDFIEPCLALLSARAPESDTWIHEIKLDGYRMQARLAGGEVRLRTRTGLDWTKRFQSVADALRPLADKHALIDGEIVVETAGGVSSFSALQDELKSGSSDNFVYYVFDLLYCGGDLRRLPLIERKRMLRELLLPLPERGQVRFSEDFESTGPILLDHACRLKLEGIVSKRSDAPYRSGRTGDWLKTKCSDRQEFVIAGIVPVAGDASAVGSLVLGYYEDGVLKYAGRTGTGFTQRNARALWRQLRPLVVKRVPFESMPSEERRARRAIWIEPRVVAEVEVRGWTHGGRVRHAAFKGLREDKDAREVGREEAAVVAPSPQSKRQTVRVRESRSQASSDTARVRLTNPDRVYWEDVGVTKQGLADYYTRVWDWIAPHVTGRVLSLVRCPEGASKQCFFQKHASAGLESAHLALVPEDGDKVIAIDSLDGLIALVQAGVLEVHARGSRIEHLEEADRIVFDLDPGPEVGWDAVKRAAREVRARLQRLKLTSFLKTTGGKGLHVVLPIAPTPWGEVKAFAHGIAGAMAADDPDRYVATAAKRARTGRIFVDYLRNSREATAIAPYSTRARPGATVSVPIAWSELAALSTPNRYTVGNLMQRLGRLRRDPWAGIAQVKQRLPQMDRGVRGSRRS